MRVPPNKAGVVPWSSDAFGGSTLTGTSRGAAVGTPGLNQAPPLGGALNIRT
jgi:hypothetical protein